jgi:hypothetical protein
MTVAYWKMVAENVAKGLGEKTIKRIGTGGKLLGRAGAVVGVGLMAYELFKSYKDNIEGEPAYQEMTILQAEMEKWGSAISCLGRQPYEDKAYGDFEEGGAINALFPKKLVGKEGEKAVDPNEAATLIQRAAKYIEETENLSEDHAFEEKQKELVSRLQDLAEKIKQTRDYGPIQRALADIVNDIRPIESGYSARIYDCSREIQKTLGSNAAWAAISMLTLGFVKKPEGEPEAE